MATIKKVQNKKIICVSRKEMLCPAHTQNVSMIMSTFTTDGRTVMEDHGMDGLVYKWEFAEDFSNEVLQNALLRLGLIS